ADMLVVMSELFRERGDLAAAEQHLQKVEGLGDLAGLPQNRYRRRAALSLIRADQGDLSAAIDLLDQAERLYTGDFSPNVRPIAAMRARVWAGQGWFAEALDWVHAQRLSAAD